jgi:hypothetical protein
VLHIHLPDKIAMRLGQVGQNRPEISRRFAKDSYFCPQLRNISIADDEEVHIP